MVQTELLRKRKGIMEKPLEKWQQYALLELAATHLEKVNGSLGYDTPAALVQKLQVALTKIDSAKAFIDAGWIRCPNCKQVSYNKTDIAEHYCPNCSMFHDQFDPIVTQESKI